MPPEIRRGHFFGLALLLVMVAWLTAGAVVEPVGRQRIAQMSDQEKQHLLEKSQLFYGLDSDERQRLRKIHEEITSAEDRPALEERLQRYSEWVQTLPAPQRVELSSMTASECLAAVRHLLEQQEEQRLAEMATRRLSLEDMRVVAAWLDRFVTRFEDPIEPLLQKIVSQMPRTQRMQFNRIRQPRERARVLTASLIMRTVNEGRMELETLELDLQQHFDDLIGQLSEAGQAAHMAVVEPAERNRMVGRWLMTAALWSLTAVSDEELERFYLEDLSVEDRDYVDQLSGPRFRQELVELYRRYRRERTRAGNVGATRERP